jgi:hypothetical protein
MSRNLAAEKPASKGSVPEKTADPAAPPRRDADEIPSCDAVPIGASGDVISEPWDPPEWLVNARNRLTRLASLPHNWDGEGGSSPQPQAIRSAERVLVAIETYRRLPPVHIGPSSSGGLGLEWRHENRDLDLDISPDGSIEYLKSIKAGARFDVEDMEDGEILPDDIGEIRLLVGWLMTGS